MATVSNAFRTFLFCILIIVLIPSISSAQGTIIGPVYPAPLGNTLSVSGGTDGIGEASGITWTIGNVALTTYDVVYWGPVDRMIKMSMDNNTYTEDEIMDYRSDLSTLNGGIMMFTGSTSLYDKYARATKTVYTRCVITVTTLNGTPLPLIDASVLGLPDNVGAVGSLQDWGISATGYFRVNIKLEATYNTASYQPAFTFYENRHYNSSERVYSSVDGAFYYRNSLPVLVTNNTINMQEGQTVALPQSALKAQDVESPTTQIVYTIGPTAASGRVPAHGLLRLNGVPLGIGSTFTQDNLNRNQVTYQHNGDASTSDSFTFNLQDGQGDTSPAGSAAPYVFNINISQVNHPPVAINGSGSATVGSIYYGQFQATDSDLPAQPLTFSLIQNGKKGMANLMSFNNGQFSYEPQEDAFGRDTLIFQVNDGEANAVNPGRYIITLINNHPPEIDEIADVVLEENSTFSVVIATTDMDGDHVSLTVNNLPSFASFSTPGDGSGTIAINPLTGDVGDYPGIEVVAEDDGTPTRSSRTEFMISVVPELKPVISVYPATRIDFGTVYTGADSTEVLTIYNTGNMPLTVDRIYTSNDDYDQFEVVDPGNQPEIMVKDSAKYEVHFKPTRVGAKRTMLVIDSNDPVHGWYTIELSGDALLPPSDVLYHLGDLKAPPTVTADYPVAIEIADEKALCAFGFNLVFDPAVLTYERWTRGPVIPSDGWSAVVTPVNDSTVNISGYRKYGDPITSSGDLAWIGFLVNGSAPLGPTDLRIEHPSVGDCQGQDLVASCHETGHIIVDIYASLTGRIRHFDPLAPGLGRPLSKIPVLLTDLGGNIVDQTVTDNDGNYEIDSVLTLQDYILLPKWVDDQTNLRRTVNSTDAYRAFSAANESLPFPNPFQYEIGDANNSNSFNSTDAYVIFQLASYQLPDLRTYGLDDWNFVPLQSMALAKCTFDFPHEIDLSNLLRDTAGLDFIGGVNGDVNGTGNDLLSFPKTQGLPVDFQIASARIQTDGILSVPVYIGTNGSDVCAFQFEIGYNEGQMQYAGYIPSELTPAADNWMMYLEDSPEHTITAAAFVMNTEYALRGDGVLVYLNFRLTGETYESAELSLDFSDTPVAGGVDGYDLPVSWKDGILSVEEPQLPLQLVLYQNYPNPFNPSTTIEFTLPQNGRVGLKIYNTIGELVAEPINGELPAGTHRCTWDAAGSASGIYYYRLETREGVLTRKMLLVR
jgi:hypothetical protein